MTGGHTSECTFGASPVTMATFKPAKSRPNYISSRSSHSLFLLGRHTQGVVTLATLLSVFVVAFDINIVQSPCL